MLAFILISLVNYKSCLVPQYNASPQRALEIQTKLVNNFLNPLTFIPIFKKNHIHSNSNREQLYIFITSLIISYIVF